jgi:hypothetical protein
MKTTMILAALFGGSLAAPSTMRHAKRQSGPSSDQVAAAIDRWNSEVVMVNNFLNTPPMTGAPYGNFTSFTLSVAQDEPNQLAILAEIPALSTNATNAIANLKQVFGGVLTNLQDIINNQNDLDTINAHIKSINQIRCCNVLPDLDILWPAAAEAEGVSNLVITVAPKENACATTKC